jgi:glycosyltransferase involved in cell wall biosynthesis
LDALKIRKRVRNLGQVLDKHLAKLYRCSMAFVYPSMYEGFGIPPLEAMACGTVVIAANSPSIPEVVGDAAILFDPNSIDELTERILALPKLGSRREEYIRRGKDRAARFSWKNTAAKTFEIYRQVSS